MINKRPKIKFVSTTPGLELIEECLPKPASKFMPEWWKKTKLINDNYSMPNINDIIINIKNCPSFPDFFSQGYIVPMWTDTVLRYNDETAEWSWVTSDSSFTWDIHGNNQYLDYVDHYFLTKKAKIVFKANSPWRILADKGYSVIQLPLFYHFNGDFTVLPGIIDSDIHSEINQQVVYLSDQKQIFIKRGTPFVQYIPFKREKYNFEVLRATKKELEVFLTQGLKLTTKFNGSHAYNNLRKERDA